jgi:hypothetical protein
VVNKFPLTAASYQLKVAPAGAVAVKVAIPPVQIVSAAAVGLAGVGFTVIVAVSGNKGPQQFDVIVKVTVYVIGALVAFGKVIDVEAVLADAMVAAGETDQL